VAALSACVDSPIDPKRDETESSASPLAFCLAVHKATDPAQCQTQYVMSVSRGSSTPLLIDVVLLDGLAGDYVEFAHSNGTAQRNAGIDYVWQSLGSAVPGQVGVTIDVAASAQPTFYITVIEAYSTGRRSMAADTVVLIVR
jgi:hypothetical protein